MYPSDTGSARWTRDTRTIHEIVLTMTDGMLEAITPGDEVRLILQGRDGAVIKTLRYRELDKLLGTKQEP